jgi:demethylmenaquinone methyltransferase/2-methoxy-6-polyprenyl-1,4-benzoquinol methylase
MANQFYDPGAQRAEKVRTLFDRIASRYDLINDIQSFGLHRRWKKQVIHRANPRPGDRALDVCCGTGDLANALAKAGAVATGLDFSHQMLDRAAKRKISDKVDFIQGDAQNLPFDNGSFDIVTIGYGLRNLADWQKGVVEMARILKPGGRLVILEFGRPNVRIWRAIYFGYLRLFVPVLGLVFCGSPSAYSYILESLKHYPGQEAVAQKMGELGLATNNTDILAGAMTITCGLKPA